MENRIKIMNRDDYPMFVPTPKEEYRTNFRIKSLRIKRVSPDEKYKELKAAGRQIDITNPNVLQNGKRPLDGIFSPLFGADTTQDSPIFTCDCHKLTGGENRGKICKNCGTECRSIEADLRITGHVDVAPYHVLTYHGYNAFTKVFKKSMNSIITTSMKISKSGKPIKSSLPTIMDLYDDYDEKYKDAVGLDKNLCFMTKIPIYSARLRPLIQYSSSTQSITDVNKKFLSITNLAGVLSLTKMMTLKHRELEVQRALNQIQQDLIWVWEFINEQLNGKTGAFRHALTSGRVDNSARLVITLGTDLMPHEVDLPYQTMMVQYEEEIANYLKRLKDIPLGKAISMVDAHVTDPEPLYVNIINQILKTGTGVWVLVDRNPTISKYGIGYMRVRRIHNDFHDFTMHLPPDPLGNYKADFDGDQITAMFVKNPKYHRYFLNICPTYAFIDRANAKFNRDMDFKKDYAALLSIAWDIDKAYDRCLLTPDETSTTLLRDMGLDDTGSDYMRDLREKTLSQLASMDLNGPFAARYLSPFWGFGI